MFLSYLCRVCERGEKCMVQTVTINSGTQGVIYTNKIKIHTNSKLNDAVRHF